MKWCMFIRRASGQPADVRAVEEGPAQFVVPLVHLGLITVAQFSSGLGTVPEDDAVERKGTDGHVVQVVPLHELGLEFLDESPDAFLDLLLGLPVLPPLGQHHRVIAHQRDLQETVVEHFGDLDVSQLLDGFRKLVVSVVAIKHVQLLYHPTVNRHHALVVLLSHLDIPQRSLHIRCFFVTDHSRPELASAAAPTGREWWGVDHCAFRLVDQRVGGADSGFGEGFVSVVELEVQEEVGLALDVEFAVGQVIDVFEHVDVGKFGYVEVPEFLSPETELFAQHSVCCQYFSLFSIEPVDGEESLDCKNDSVLQQAEPEVLSGQIPIKVTSGKIYYKNERVARLVFDFLCLGERSVAHYEGGEHEVTILSDVACFFGGQINHYEDFCGFQGGQQCGIGFFDEGVQHIIEPTHMRDDSRVGRTFQQIDSANKCWISLSHLTSYEFGNFTLLIDNFAEILVENPCFWTLSLKIIVKHREWVLDFPVQKKVDVGKSSVDESEVIVAKIYVTWDDWGAQKRQNGLFLECHKARKPIAMHLFEHLPCILDVLDWLVMSKADSLKSFGVRQHGFKKLMVFVANNQDIIFLVVFEFLQFVDSGKKSDLLPFVQDFCYQGSILVGVEIEYVKMGGQTIGDVVQIFFVSDWIGEMGTFQLFYDSFGMGARSEARIQIAHVIKIRIQLQLSIGKSQYQNGVVSKG